MVQLFSDETLAGCHKLSTAIKKKLVIDYSKLSRLKKLEELTQPISLLSMRSQVSISFSSLKLVIFVSLSPPPLTDTLFKVELMVGQYDVGSAQQSWGHSSLKTMGTLDLNIPCKLCFDWWNCFHWYFFMIGL